MLGDTAATRRRTYIIVPTCPRARVLAPVSRGLFFFRTTMDSRVPTVVAGGVRDPREQYTRYNNHHAFRQNVATRRCIVSHRISCRYTRVRCSSNCPTQYRVLKTSDARNFTLSCDYNNYTVRPSRVVIIYTYDVPTRVCVLRSACTHARSTITYLPTR